MGNQLCAEGSSWSEAEGKCYIAPALMTKDICLTKLVSPDNADGASTYSGGTCNYNGKDSTYCAYPSCVGIQHCEGLASNFCEG